MTVTTFFGGGTTFPASHSRPGFKPKQSCFFTFNVLFRFWAFQSGLMPNPELGGGGEPPHWDVLSQLKWAIWGEKVCFSAHHLSCELVCGSHKDFTFFFFIYIFFPSHLFLLLYFYFWLHWVFVAVCGLSLVAASGGYFSLWCVGFSLRWLLLLWRSGSRRAGFSSCGAQAQWLWCTGLVAPRHVGSSWTRDQTRVPCIVRRILNHFATGESQDFMF